MTEKQAAKNFAQGEPLVLTKQRNAKLFQTITLTALFLFWIGYGYALYTENDRNISSYSLLILAFSSFNANVLFSREKAANKVLNILAKVNGVLFFVWVIATVISLILK